MGSLRHPMPMSPSLLSPMLIPQPGLSISLFLATTRETSPLDSCGGFWPVKFCVFVVPFPVNCNGMLCRICSFTAILKRPKRRNKPAKKHWPLKPHLLHLLDLHWLHLAHLLKVPVSQSLMIGLNKLLHLQPHLLSVTGLPRLQLHQVHLLLIQATNGEV